ncbi:hypothetical protein [Sphingobium sp. B8D3C]|uniref:hypothetical protein n=1 Tax=Sphingobium sp. B8D3C TaxID=2940586 RepID=UPI0022259AB0|nr:hypothetical protein [Sphingobium sp. B8D3C]
MAASINASADRMTSIDPQPDKRLYAMAPRETRFSPRLARALFVSVLMHFHRRRKPA